MSQFCGADLLHDAPEFAIFDAGPAQNAIRGLAGIVAALIDEK